MPRASGTWASRRCGAFRSARAGEGISLVGGDGRELVWIDRVDQLPAARRALLEEELAVRDFAPTLSSCMQCRASACPAPGP